MIEFWLIVLLGFTLFAGGALLGWYLRGDDVDDAHWDGMYSGYELGVGLQALGDICNGAPTPPNGSAR